VRRPTFRWWSLTIISSAGNVTLAVLFDFSFLHWLTQGPIRSGTNGTTFLQRRQVHSSVQGKLRSPAKKGLAAVPALKKRLLPTYRPSLWVSPLSTVPNITLGGERSSKLTSKNFPQPQEGRARLQGQKNMSWHSPASSGEPPIVSRQPACATCLRRTQLRTQVVRLLACLLLFIGCLLLRGDGD